MSPAVLLIAAQATAAARLDRLLAALPPLTLPLVVCAPVPLQIEHRLARDKERPEPGSIYLAPDGYHLLVDRDGFALSADPPVAGARPSIDALFESAADAHGPAAAALLLSPDGGDGAAGLAAIRDRGGSTLCPGMDVPLDELARQVLAMVRSW